MAALKYWLWLSSAGLSPNAKAALLGCFGDAEAVFHAPDGAYSGVKGVTRSEAAILERRDLSLAEDVYAECERQGLQMISLQDAAYPTRLKHIFAPPVVLYVKGRLPDMETQPPIAVIGTRRGSDYGLRMASALAGEIVRCGGVVISLLTGGIERAAAQSALREGGGCIGVLATAHERETHSLAARVAESGALISEYPPFTRTVNSFFRDRNRIAAGLSAGVLVVEAPERSGTHLFVQEAAEQGKEIFAVPGNADAVNSAGTLRMIREGAKLVTAGWEVMDEFEGMFTGVHRASERAKEPEQELSGRNQTSSKEERKEKKPIDKLPEKGYIDLSKQLADLTELQLAILAAIDRPAMHLDDIIENTGFSASVLLAQLTFLQIRGLVLRESGQRYSLNIQKP